MIRSAWFRTIVVILLVVLGSRHLRRRLCLVVIVSLSSLPETRSIAMVEINLLVLLVVPYCLRLLFNVIVLRRIFNVVVRDGLHDLLVYPLFRRLLGIASMRYFLEWMIDDTIFFCYGDDVVVFLCLFRTPCWLPEYDRSYPYSLLSLRT